MCRNVSEQLIDRLLPSESYNEGQRALHLREIDGDYEDFTRTVNLLRNFSLVPGLQIHRVMDTKLFSSKDVAKTIWEKADKAYIAADFEKAGRFIRQLFELAGMQPSVENGEEIVSLSAFQFKELFGFAKPQGNIGWIKELASHLMQAGPMVPVSSKSSTSADLFMEAYTHGLPPDNIIILITEVVDKRSKIYKYVQEQGVVFDLSVGKGGSSAVRKDKKTILQNLIKRTLDDFGKKLDPEAMVVLLERLGFQPVAAVKETEKLALFVGDSQQITKKDVDEIIGRTREEALYELTEAFTKKYLEGIFLTLTRLMGQGIHGLAILATLRNHFKKMLLIVTLKKLTVPTYDSRMSFPAFQKSYLPKLKSGREDWAVLWKGHPYGLYMLFKQTEKFNSPLIQRGLQEVLKAEYRFKGSGIPDRLILENLFFNLLLV